MGQKRGHFYNLKIEPHVWHSIKTFLKVIAYCGIILFLVTSCEKSEEQAHEQIYEKAYNEGYSEGRFKGYREGYGQAVVDVCDNASIFVAQQIWNKEFVDSAFSKNGVDVYPD